MLKNMIGLLLGVIVALFAMFLSLNLPILLPMIGANNLELGQIGLLFIAIIAPFVGLLWP